MNELTLSDIRAHAAREYPRESCGVVVVRHGSERYYPCKNNAARDDHFDLDPADYANAADQGEVVMIVHSHPNASPLPSPADMYMCEQTNVPWFIISWPTGLTHEIKPSGYVAPLIGRQYQYGVFDCYSLVRDYFKQKLDVVLPDYPRPAEWWLNGYDLYNDHFKDANFVEVTDTPKLHDVFLMQVFSPVINHAAIYVGDGMILQHCRDLLSSRDIMGGYWQRVTVKRVRYKELL